MSNKVEIDKDHLDTLLWFAKRGDALMAKRYWRNWLRRNPVCSGEEREHTCASCQAFAAAESALREAR